MIRDLFLNSTILVTFITIGNQFLKQYDFNTPDALQLKILRGVLNGLLGCILMFYSVNIEPNLIIDFRNIAIIISSIFGGFVSSFVAALIIGSFRIFYFGITTSSIAAFIVVLLMGIGCPLITLKVVSLKKKWIYSTLLCAIIVSCSFTIFISNKTVLITLISAYWIGNIIIATFSYIYTTNLTISNQLYRQYKEDSTKDFLTGLNNVRQFDKAFNAITTKLLEKDEHLSLLFIDIDFFKKVNDTYGHAEGDIVLKELSKIITNTCRDFDIVSRNGGEEFSVMLMDCIQQQAVIIAERIRLAVENYSFTLSSGKTINITISIGISTYPDTTRDFSKLIKEADIALYEAKRTGRNKVVVAKNQYN